MGGRRFVVILSLVAVAVAFFMMRGAPQRAPEPVAEPAPAESPPQTPSTPEPVRAPVAGSVTAPTPVAPAEAAVDAPVKKLEILKEILDSRHDNDPRLDTEFRDLDPAMKAKLQKFYHELPAEKLNSRGTVVFLLGRNIRTSEDARFFNFVLQQAPCLSLAHCAEAGEPDPESSSDVTLAYPQIVATVGLVKGWGAISDPTRRAELLESLKAAARSSNPALARSARAALVEIQKTQN